MKKEEQLDLELFCIESVEKYLPKGYRTHTYLPSWGGTGEIITIFSATVVIQHREYEDAKFLGILPYKRKKWVDIGEFPPSVCDLTLAPWFRIYAGYEAHLNILEEAFKETPFEIYLERKNTV